MAITFVIDSEAVSSDGSNVTTTGVDTSGADLIVLGLSYDAAQPAAPPTVSDNKSNTWQALTISNTTNLAARIHYCISPTVGTGHTFTAAETNSLPSICMAAFSGATGGFDQQNGGTNASSTTLQPGSVTPTTDGQVVLTVVAFQGNDTLTIDGSFNITGQFGEALFTYGIGLAYLIQTTAAAANPTWTKNGSAAEMAARIATFKATAAAAGHPTMRRWGGVPGMSLGSRGGW